MKLLVPELFREICLCHQNFHGTVFITGVALKSTGFGAMGMAPSSATHLLCALGQITSFLLRLELNLLHLYDSFWSSWPMTLHCTIKSFRVVTIVSNLIQPSIQLWEEPELGILWILSIVGSVVSGGFVAHCIEILEP